MRLHLKGNYFTMVLYFSDLEPLFPQNELSHCLL